MTAAAAPARDPDHLHSLGEHLGPAPKRIVTGYGFWIFLLGDMVMFSCFFAAYAVLGGQTAGGPNGAELFNLKNVVVETGCLLMSSFACGMASIAADVRDPFWFQIAMAVTCLLGSGFFPSNFTNSPIWSRAATARREAHSCRPSSRWSAAMACMSRPASSGC
jgi:cytochrome o ubiquinol oxidase subunit III